MVSGARGAATMPHTYLITGGAGNLACQLTFELADPATRILLFDRAERPVAAVAPGSHYVRGDLTHADEVRALFREHRPDTVLHLASLLSGASEENRPLAWQVNADGCFTILEEALATGVRRMFFASSLASYGSPLPDPLPEDYPQWPTGLYGVTKVACERLGAYYHARHGLDFRGLRLPMVLSRHAPPGAASAYASRAFVEAVESRRFVFRVRPSTRVSAVYVRDVLHGMKALLQAPANRLTRRVYNIFALAPTAQEIADAIAARIKDVDLRFEPDPKLITLVESWPAGIVDESARRDWDWQPSYELPRLADDFLKELQSTG
jgi:threonine 3-dehydrogenase